MKSAIRWMAHNHVAANLLMMALVVGGLVMGISIKQEVFPEIALDKVQVTVAYPGAGPEEVEEGIILKIEENLSGVNGIKEIKSVANEGYGTVTAEVLQGEDVDLVMQDVKAEVDRITTFPREAEKPVITKLVRRSEVIYVAVYGDLPERSLREYAESVSDDLLALPQITQTELAGVRPYEISIDVPEDSLRRYGLTLDAIAERVRRASIDLPAGTVKAAGGEILIRTKEKRYKGYEYADITIVHNPDGSDVKLGDIANVRDSFRETDEFSVFDGKRAALVAVYRLGEQKPTGISRVVKDYVKRRGATLPPSVKLATLNDRSELFQSRLDLLTKNAFLGLILVFITLGLFLQIRLALWVMLGIPISFLGALFLMPGLDVSINMISLFAFILALGIVVDDAIVVGENVFDHRNKGKGYLKAAVDGAVEVSGPVVVSVLTTIATFAPLMYISGNIGKFIRTIPLVVIPILAISLVESLFILPAHLGHGKPSKKPHGILGAIERVRRRFGVMLDWFVSGPFLRALGLCARNRYSTLAAAIAILLVSVGLVGGGVVKFRFMPEVDGDFVIASLKMPIGTPVEDTAKVQALMEHQARKLVSEYDARRKDGTSVLRDVYSIVGGSIKKGQVGEVDGTGSNIAEVALILTPSEIRKVAATEITNRWRKMVGDVPGAESLTFDSNIVHFGANIDIQLAHDDFKVLRSAADRIKSTLAGYPGVGDIADNYSTGKKELKLRLRPEARTLGITEEDLGRQVRGAFYGAEAMRFQRGKNELKVMVRYPEDERKSIGDLERMRIRTPGGGEVPFAQAAYVEEGRGYSAINRTDRKRVINITASVDSKTANAEEILAEMKGTVLRGLSSDYPGLTFDLEGEEKERRESMGSMKRGFAMALFAIFAMLAIPFRSYSQPLIIMAAIPFGIVGAILGHLIMGYNLSILSLFGLVALSGVLVNDSLLLIDYINTKREEGLDAHRCVLEAGRRRFRPILLTSLTTAFGLLPIILETSVQAQFLIPMAISLGFGILFATAITLILTPSLYLILEDIRGLFGLAPSHSRAAIEEEKREETLTSTD
ncbi:MAG: efflux RND transporter permease subunit [Thermodesulfobacteriota bacterium]